MGLVTASDGLPARENGPWAERKLAFLERFVPPALNATERKHRRYYLDLFAGPGRNVDSRDSRREFTGSPIRILTLRGDRRSDLAFTDAVFFNQSSRDHEALLERVEQLYDRGEAAIPRDHVQVIRGDTNHLLPVLMRDIPPLDYVFAFADIEAPKQWPWETVEALTARGHRSVDLYMLFPLEMGINRLLAYEGRSESGARTLDIFFGTDRWREIVGRRCTPAQAPLCKRELLELYVRRLGERWRFASDVMKVVRTGRAGLYRMLFASNHEAGEKIARWAQAQTVEEAARDQRELF